jgi:flagellar biosynthesis/type III secretory pathway chaperone
MNDFLCGVIEGFYGRPWTTAQRLELFSWMQAWGMNTYMYGPKDDLKMRAAWRELYDESELSDLKVLLKACQEKNISFVYTIAPGLDIHYADPKDLQGLIKKVDQLSSEGVKHICILFDDIPHHMNEEDKKRFGSFAKAQAHVSNALLEHARRHTDGLFLFCPTDYCGRMAKPSVLESAYLQELGEHLHQDIDIFWTGPEIVSETVSVKSIQELQRVLKRKPVIWENLHANDYDIRRIYFGPFAGRPLELRGEIKGILSNPNNEFEANFVPLKTLAMYSQDETYEPRAAYLQALKEWLPRFKTHGKEAITLEELELLGDLFYLPFEHGEKAKRILDTAKKLLSARTIANEELQFLETTARAVGRLFEKLTELDNRDLLYSLYNYVWEIRHELDYLVGYLKWVQAGKPDERFGKPDKIANTFRGGVAAEIERLLPMDETGAFYLEEKK